MITRYARFVAQNDPGASPGWARVEGIDAAGIPTASAHLIPLAGSPWTDPTPTGRPAIPLVRVRLLAPTTPSKVVGIGTNYHAHAAEMGRTIPSVPKMFLKPSTAVVGPGAPIQLPPGTTRVDHEAELAVVIGRRASCVSVEDAGSFIAGATVCNDVTARDFQRTDGTFARAKGFDSFCPLGPWLTVGLPLHNLRVQAWVNGVHRQDGRTSDLIFGVAQLVSFVSHVTTLLPGDVISTGTPSGVGPLVAGQSVRVAVEGLGQLDNPVQNRADRSATAP